MSNLPVNRIVIHCSGTPPDWMADQPLEAQIAEIRRWHSSPKPVGRGWRREGYHWFVGRLGATLPGRPENEQGAHVRGMNRNSLGICLIGGKYPDGRWAGARDAFSTHFTPEQNEALRELVSDIKARHERWDGPVVKVSGHNDHDRGKSCPGFGVAEWMAAQDPMTHRPREERTTESRLSDLERRVQLIEGRLA